MGPGGIRLPGLALAVHRRSVPGPVTSLAQLPEETFCLECGPDAALERDGSAMLRCPRCGASQQLPALPLFLVTGASGSGKTTVTGPLRSRLPDCDVFEIDATLQVAALSWEVWRNTWLRVVHEVALGGRVSVLCGSLQPDQLEHLPARRLIGPVHCCVLDCPDAVRASRLRARPAWRGTSTEAAIAEHQRYAAWLRASTGPCFDTGALTPGQVADQVAAWIRQQLRASPVSR
jgi:hypothetical protein